MVRSRVFRSPRASRMVRVVYQLRRGPHGLGIDVSGRNEIVKLLPNGQAAMDGLALVGDIVEAVDSRPLQGRRLQDAMVPGQRVYELIVQRSSVPLEAAVARSFSPVPLLRCLELQVSRGPKGLGIDIGNVASVRGLIPGGMAEREGVILPGDLVIAVDRVMVGPQGLKPLIAPGRSMYRLMVLRPEVVVSQTTAVIGAEPSVTAICEEAKSRARAAIAENERALISRAAAAAASSVPPRGVNPSSIQADLESATQVSGVTKADAEDLHAERAVMETTVQTLAARPRNLSDSELRCLQQDQFVDSGLIESERRLATERAAQLERLTAQLSAAKSEKLATSDAAKSKAAVAAREEAEPSDSKAAVAVREEAEPSDSKAAVAVREEAEPSDSKAALAVREEAEPSESKAAAVVREQAEAESPPSGETALGGKEELRGSTTPTSTPCAAPTTVSPSIWGAAASAARDFLWGTNAATPAAKQESHDLTSSCPQRVQDVVAAKSVSAAAQNPMHACTGSEGERDGAKEGQMGGGPDPPVRVVSTKKAEQKPAAHLAVLWDIESCPPPSDSGGAIDSGAMASVSRRWEGIAGPRATIWPVIVYESTGDVHAVTHDLAYASTVKQGADSADRVGTMLTDLLVHVLDYPRTAILLITNQPSVLAAAVQLAARGFGLSVALPDDFDAGSLPSSERIALLRGLYCWPQLLPYTASTGRAASVVVEQEQKTASASHIAQATASATAFPCASFRTATHNSIVLTISHASTPMVSAAASCSDDARESVPLTEAVVDEDPLAKMIRQAQSLGDDALVAKLQAIGS